MLRLLTIALLLLLSWFIPPTKWLWAEFDVWAFQLLNGTLKNAPFTQIFWALANVKLADLFGAAFIVTFTLLYVFDAGKKEAPHRLAQFFYYLIWFEIGILSLKELLFYLLVAINFLRDSPSLVFADTILLSKAVPWLKIKDSSHWCYPSDHAFIVLEWVGFICFYAGWRLGAVAFVSSWLFILPRLIGGAHWMTDVLLGSVPLALFFVAIACYTPLYPFFMKYLERFTKKVFFHDQK